MFIKRAHLYKIKYFKNLVGTILKIKIFAIAQIKVFTDDDSENISNIAKTHLVFCAVYVFR